MRITLPNLKHSFICPFPVLVLVLVADSGFGSGSGSDSNQVPDSGCPCFPYAPSKSNAFHIMSSDEVGRISCICSSIIMLFLN